MIAGAQRIMTQYGANLRDDLFAIHGFVIFSNTEA